MKYKIFTGLVLAVFIVVLGSIFYLKSKINESGSLISTKFDIQSKTARDLLLEVEKREAVIEDITQASVINKREARVKDSTIKTLVLVKEERDLLKLKVNEYKRMVDSLNRVVKSKPKFKVSDIDTDRYERSFDSLEKTPDN